MTNAEIAKQYGQEYYDMLNPGGVAYMGNNGVTFTHDELMAFDEVFREIGFVDVEYSAVNGWKLTKGNSNA